MRPNRSDRTHRRPRRALAAVAVTLSLIVAACGSSGAESDGKSSTPSTTKPSKVVANALCDAAITASSDATDDLRALVNEHIEAFQAAMAALEAESNGDHAGFTANAAKFREYVNTETTQAARIDADDANVAKTMSACRKALGGDPMPSDCEDAVQLLGVERKHLIELLATVDTLYSAGEQAIRGVETNNASMVETASSQISASMTAWDAAIADDEATYDASDKALQACDLTTPSSESMGSVPGQ